MRLNRYLRRQIHNAYETSTHHLGTQVLVGPNVVLTRLSEADMGHADEWAYDRDGNYFHVKHRFNSEQQLREFITFMDDAYMDNDIYFWVMHERLPGGDPRHPETVPYKPENVGILYVDDLGPFGNWVDLDFVLGKTYWPTEYMPEALGVVMDYLFDRVGINNVMVKFRIDNAPGIRMLQRIGFARDGIMRDYYPNLAVEDSWYDAVNYSMLAHEWAKRRENLGDRYLDFSRR